MTEAFILDAVRSPIGRHRGGLSSVRSDDLAAAVIESLLDRNAGSREHLEEILLGATNQAGEDNRNVARMAALLAGLPYEVTGATINRLCGSGMEAIVQAGRAIRLGDADLIVAGGVESMSRAPYVMPKAEEPLPRKPPPIYDTSLGWRFPNASMAERFELQSMGETAENLAEEFGIEREAQDAFALESHRRAADAWAAGAFDEEVVPIELPPTKRGAEARILERDEGIRADSSPEKLSQLKAVFRRGGTVTAGNSSPLSDGAAALLLGSKAAAEALGLSPMARIVGSAVAGVHPNRMGIGPVPATRKLLERTGVALEEIDLVELNEAFAAQSLACIAELGLAREKVNLNGGAIALGHPIGCSGARVVTTLVHALRAKGGRYGLATLCIGVGQGLALLIERVEP